jgi:hypothetical protein
LAWPYESTSSSTPFFGHVGLEPGALGGEERFAVNREPVVLVSVGEQVLLPDDPERRPLVLAEFCVMGEEPMLFERLRDLPPQSRLVLLWLSLLPDRRLVLT